MNYPDIEDDDCEIRVWEDFKKTGRAIYSHHGKNVSVDTLLCIIMAPDFDDDKVVLNRELYVVAGYKGKDGSRYSDINLPDAVWEDMFKEIPSSIKIEWNIIGTTHCFETDGTLTYGDMKRILIPIFESNGFACS
jgi:hypothetical protein